MNRLLPSCVAFLALISVASATDWYVDVHGTPPGTGTLADPYTSIQYAVTRPTTHVGDSVLVLPGTYVGNLVMDGAYVHVRSVAGPEVTVIAPATPGNTVLIESGTVEGFTIQPAISAGAAAFLYLGDITRCIVQNQGNVGLGVWVEDSGGLSECTVTGFQTGIGVNNFGGYLFLRNTIVTGNNLDLSVSQAAAQHLQIHYCAGISNIDASLYGPGNLNGDVGFWDPARSNLHLRPGSMCIDSGDPASPLDPDGSRIDIGAWTYDASYAPAPTAYCTGKLNSQGCVPAIGSSGSASASSASPFMVTASNELSSKVGLLLLGQGEIAQPFQGGTLCVQSPLKRVGVQNSGGSGACTGTFAFDMNVYVQSGAHPGLVPGALAYVQWWSRDPQDPAGFGSALSDALRFGVAP